MLPTAYMRKVFQIYCINNPLFNSEISPDNVQTVVIPFINKYFSVNSLSDYDHKYMKLDQTHGEIADHVEALLVSCEVGQFPIDTDNSSFFIYKLNRPDPEQEMIEVGYTNKLNHLSGTFVRSKITDRDHV